VAALVSLSGCSALQMKNDKAELAWEARREHLMHVDRFTLQARVSSGGLFGVKGNLHWRQDGDTFAMRVAGPFGVGAANITGRGSEVEIRSARGTFRTTDPEKDIRERLGWAFPVSHLRHWVLGTPAPGTRADFELDALGRLVTLEQDDWTIEFEEYQRSGVLELPRRFQIANDEVRIKVVVDEWTGLPGMK
jgi:outer membrane lipoprotein LolB